MVSASGSNERSLSEAVCHKSSFVKGMN